MDIVALPAHICDRRLCCTTYSPCRHWRGTLRSRVADRAPTAVCWAAERCAHNRLHTRRCTDRTGATASCTSDLTHSRRRRCIRSPPQSHCSRRTPDKFQLTRRRREGCQRRKQTVRQRHRRRNKRQNQPRVATVARNNRVAARLTQRAHHRRRIDLTLGAEAHETCLFFCLFAVIYSYWATH